LTRLLQQAYQNEAEVGEAIKGRDRSEIYVLSKLSTDLHGQEEEGIKLSLSAFGLD
jgi:diketogulonate reductase-like aldo/keto reductase